MKQMKIPKEMEVPANYDSDKLPQTVKTLHPVIFHDGDAFCCLLGPDPETGVFGCGITQEDAVKDWDIALHQRIDAFDGSDETAQYAIDSLKASNDPAWQKSK